jgi:hypothetical protein
VFHYSSTKPWRRMGEWMYRSTFSLPRHKLGISGQFHAPAALLPGKEPPIPIGKEVGVNPRAGVDDVERENSWPYRDSNSEPSLIQPVVSRYTGSTKTPKSEISLQSINGYRVVTRGDMIWVEATGCILQLLFVNEPKIFGMITRLVAAENNELYDRPFMIVAQLVNSLPSLYKTEGSSPCSQKPATGPCAAHRGSGEAEPLEWTTTGITHPWNCHGFHGEPLLTAPDVRKQPAA